MLTNESSFGNNNKDIIYNTKNIAFFLKETLYFAYI